VEGPQRSMFVRTALALAAAGAIFVVQPRNAASKSGYEVSQRTPDGGLAPTRASEYLETKPELDAAGVVSLISEDGRRYYHPFNVATQALADNGVEGTAGLYFDLMVANKPALSAPQMAALKWLVENKVELPGGAITWAYPLPLYYTTFTALPGWPSAFSQARVLHALMYAARIMKDRQYLDLAIKAAKAYAVPEADGGLLGQVDGLPFFEEVPVPGGHSPHILNGHLYSVVALHDLAAETGDVSIKALADRGADTAKTLAPYYDTGQWTKYDLVPKVAGILLLIKGDGAPVTVNSGSIVAPSGEEMPLQLVSVDGANSIFKANLPGTMFLNSVVGHPGYLVKLDHAGALAGVGVAGLRPDIAEYIQIPAGAAPSTFRIPVQYLSDSTLSRVYQRWHSRLMKRIGEQAGDAWFGETAARWWTYDLKAEHDQKDARTVPILR
jgi:hypothetical protein